MWATWSLIGVVAWVGLVGASAAVGAMQTCVDHDQYDGACHTLTLFGEYGVLSVWCLACAVGLATLARPHRRMDWPSRMLLGAAAVVLVLALPFDILIFAEPFFPLLLLGGAFAGHLRNTHRIGLLVLAISNGLFFALSPIACDNCVPPPWWHDWSAPSVAALASVMLAAACAQDAWKERERRLLSAADPA